MQLSFPRHMIPNPIWEAVKVLKKLTRLPLHEIKSALEKNNIDEDVVNIKFCPSHIDDAASNDKFIHDFKEQLATLGITEVHLNYFVVTSE